MFQSAHSATATSKRVSPAAARGPHAQALRSGQSPPSSSRWYAPVLVEDLSVHQWPSTLRAHAARLGTSVAGIGNILPGNRCLHQTRCYSSPTIREQITAKSGRSQATQCANPAQTPRDCSIRHKRRSSPCVLLRSAFTRSTPRSQRSTINSSSWLPRPRRGDLATRNRHRTWRPAPAPTCRRS